MQKHDRAWPFCWARETATSATFYVGIYDRHTYAVVTSPQWSSNSQAGSAYDTVVWHWKILEMDAQFLQSYCMLLWNALMPAIFRHTQDISRWPWTTTIENKLLLQRRLCVFLTIFFFVSWTHYAWHRPSDWRNEAFLITRRIAELKRDKSWAQLSNINPFIIVSSVVPSLKDSRDSSGTWWSEGDC